MAITGQAKQALAVEVGYLANTKAFDDSTASSTGAQLARVGAEAAVLGVGAGGILATAAVFPAGAAVVAGLGAMAYGAHELWKRALASGKFGPDTSDNVQAAAWAEAGARPTHGTSGKTHEQDGVQTTVLKDQTLVGKLRHMSFQGTLTKMDITAVDGAIAGAIGAPVAMAAIFGAEVLAATIAYPMGILIAGTLAAKAGMAALRGMDATLREREGHGLSTLGAKVASRREARQGSSQPAPRTSGSLAI